MSKGLFVTGTGTDVGKTYVTGLIVKKLRESGLSAGYYKAALSGVGTACEIPPGDAKRVCDMSGLQAEGGALVSYVYQAAVSPHLAARLERRPVEMAKLVSDFNSLKARLDYITAEGSGGLVCPLRLDDQSMMLTDVVKAFALPVLIVSPSGLGAINSAVLTAAYAKSLEIPVKGFILNGYEAENFLHRDNRVQIERLTGVPVLSCIPWQASDCGISARALQDLYEPV